MTSTSPTAPSRAPGAVPRGTGCPNCPPHQGVHHKHHLPRDNTWRERDQQDALRVSPHDAERLSLSDGALAQITASRGTAEAVVESDARLQPGPAAGGGVERRRAVGERAGHQPRDQVVAAGAVGDGVGRGRGAVLGIGPVAARTVRGQQEFLAYAARSSGARQRLSSRFSGAKSGPSAGRMWPRASTRGMASASVIRRTFL
ncbi:molybdopterin dinucleotide binding domain-containing protein [Streptomyces sp. NPDC055400]